MADLKLTTVVPLNGKNYPTWKIQCRMALMREGLWQIVTGEETAPTSDESEQAKFMLRWDLHAYDRLALLFLYDHVISTIIIKSF